MRRCALVLTLLLVGCGDHCWAPGHCFEDTYTYDTAPFQYPAPTEGLWTLAASFRDGSGIFGHFTIDAEAEEIDRWVFCSHGPGEETVRYSPNTSDGVLWDGGVSFTLHEGGRTLDLVTNGGFLSTVPLGLVRRLDGSAECPECENPRWIDGNVVLSDPHRTTWVNCDD